MSIRNKQDKKLPLVSRDQVAYSHLKKKKNITIRSFTHYNAHEYLQGATVVRVTEDKFRATNSPLVRLTLFFFFAHFCVSLSLSHCENLHVVVFTSTVLHNRV